MELGTPKKKDSYVDGLGVPRTTPFETVSLLGSHVRNVGSSQKHTMRITPNLSISNGFALGTIESIIGNSIYENPELIN